MRLLHEQIGYTSQRKDTTMASQRFLVPMDFSEYANQALEYAVREAKRLVRERPGGEETARIAAARRTSDEGQDGLRAFLETRSPGWLESGD